ncbi:MAG: hypothetical protein CMD07_00760 [Flavobacteriales bacterium]|nr:hypothetical protein [Flavobacteriales bacterium]
MKNLFFYFALFSHLLIHSQDNDIGNWLIYFGNKQINEKYNFHHEVQYRNYNFIGDKEQLLIRSGIGRNFSDNLNLLIGYGFIDSNNYKNNIKYSSKENRIFQQIILKQNIWKLSFQHRYRFEQRFIDGDYKTRYRYFLNFNYPINLESLNLSRNNKLLVYISFYNEIFLNGQSKVFDRNRLYGGLGFKLNKYLKFEIGYMNQFFEDSSRDQLNIITFFNF